MEIFQSRMVIARVGRLLLSGVDVEILEICHEIRNLLALLW